MAGGAGTASASILRRDHTAPYPNTLTAMIRIPSSTSHQSFLEMLWIRNLLERRLIHDSLPRFPQPYGIERVLVPTTD